MKNEEQNDQTNQGFDVRKLLDRLLNAAWEKKAYDTVVLDVAQAVGYTDYMVVLTGRSTRHVTSIAESVIRAMRKQDGMRPLSSEGVRHGRWAVLDYGDVVVHIFLSELRSLYDLESLWSDCPRVEIQEPEWVKEFENTEIDNLGLDEDLDDF